MIAGSIHPDNALPILVGMVICFLITQCLRLAMAWLGVNKIVRDLLAVFAFIGMLVGWGLLFPRLWPN